ncbi:MAG TPA: hypothetical protein DDW52_03390 [Planctomycetaceae bacterium]|nr:hypothetical protein [Planctomycetaceae bacterium]
MLWSSRSVFQYYEEDKEYRGNKLVSQAENKCKDSESGIFDVQRLRTIIWDPRGVVGSVVVDELEAAVDSSGLDSQTLWVDSPGEILDFSALSLAVWAVENSEDLRACLDALGAFHIRGSSAFSLCFVAPKLGRQVAWFGEVGASTFVSDLAGLQAAMRTIIPKLPRLAAANPLTEGLAAFLPWPDQSSAIRFGR